jgi:hypothetical protein
MLTAERLRELLAYDPMTGTFTWRIKPCRRIVVGSIAGTVRKGRRSIGVDAKEHFASRLAWLYMTGAWPQGVVDHEDTDPSNDRWLNLRDVTQGVNSQNRRRAHKNSRTGVLGVSLCAQTGRLKAQLQTPAGRIWLGRHDTAEAARAAYLAARRQHLEGNTL